MGNNRKNCCPTNRFAEQQPKEKAFSSLNYQNIEVASSYLVFLLVIPK